MPNGTARHGSHSDVYSEVIGTLLGDGAASGASPALALSAAPLNELLPGHSRNSSGTSHSGSGSASGYGSLASQSQHSRQSSSGELGHFRSVLIRLRMSGFAAFLSVSPEIAFANFPPPPLRFVTFFL